MAPLRIAVIIGSTREGRAGGRIARWFETRASARADVSTQLVDLAEFAFPTAHPGTPNAQIALFSEEIRKADAFVVVTPEYNHSFPASLKQAIDYCYDEWHGKAVGFVSYGCGSSGHYAVDHLRTVFTELHAMTVRSVVGLDLLTFDEQPSEAAEHAAMALLDQLIWWGGALRDARPYVS